MFKKIILLIFCMVLMSCGMHMRRPEDFPSALRVMQISTEHVNNAITVSLERTLRDAHVSLHERIAPFMLILRDSRMDTEMPIVFNANAASLYTYTLSVRCILVDVHDRKIFDTRVVATETVTHNVNQTSPPVFTPLMRSTLTQNLVDNIYALLTSQATRAAMEANRKHDKSHASI